MTNRERAENLAEKLAPILRYRIGSIDDDVRDIAAVIDSAEQRGFDRGVGVGVKQIEADAFARGRGDAIEDVAKTVETECINFTLDMIARRIRAMKGKQNGLV